MPRLIAPSKDESALLPPFLELPEHAIHIPQSETEFEAAFKAMNAEPVLGFDTESKPIFNIGQQDSGPHLVQLATASQVWLLQLHRPMALEVSRMVLAAEHICKVGFGLDNDKHSLPRRLGAPLINIQDLDSRFKELDDTRQYLLYCDKGVMSRLHAHHLLSEGHANVRVYRPS